MIRFWSKVTKTKTCWVWAGATDTYGYGNIGVGSRTNRTRRVEKTHRFSWLLHDKGDIPDGMLVLHKCDNPPCVRPSHLFLGTQSDNMKDMWSKGRHPQGGAKRGIGHHNAKLTDKEVAWIRTRWENGEKQVDIADDMELHPEYVGKIVRGRVRTMARL